MSDATTNQPNILLIVTDQHRLEALGCYGAEICKTPNIDRLAAEGVRFQNTYTTTPVCSPARATIITGQYPHDHGVTANCGTTTSAVWNIPDHPRMLPRQLAKRGYACGYTGKWHLCPSPACTEWFNQPVPHNLPGTLGFEGQEFPGHGVGHAEAHRAYLRERGLTYKPAADCLGNDEWPHYQVMDGPKEASIDHFLADHTIGLIDKYAAQEKPFFIWHNHWGPHEPYVPMREFYELYKDVEIPPWPNYLVPQGLLSPQHAPEIHPRVDDLDWSYWEESIRHYYAFVTQIDYEIGRIYNHLKRTGLLDNTIIVFTSDHGEALGSHGGMTNKGYSHFEETQRIGMILRYPPQYQQPPTAAGSVRTELVSLIDLYPTLLNLAGAEPNKIESEGRSLHSLLSGGNTGWRDSVFVEFYGLHAGTLMVTCRCGDWKYGWNANARDELYNLAEDPHELVNRINDPDLEKLRSAFLARIRNHLPPGTNTMVREIPGIVRRTANEHSMPYEPAF